MRLKENKGISLIVFTIILLVLLVVAGGVIVYLLNNPVKEGTAIQTPTNVEDFNSSEKVEVKLSNAEALTKGNELYKKAYNYVVKGTENIETLLTSNSKKQFEELKKNEDNLMFSIFNDTDVGRKELVVKTLDINTIVFNVLHYGIIETDGQQERLEYTFESAFKIVKSNDEWVIDSIVGNRIENVKTDIKEENITNGEANQIGNELYEKAYLYVVDSPKKENIENKLTSNAKQQIEKIKKSEDELMVSIFDGTDVGRKEVKVKELKNNEVIFDVFHYSIVETDEQEERLEYTFEKAFKIIKLNGEWIIDSVIGNNRIENK